MPLEGQGAVVGDLSRCGPHGNCREPIYANCAGCNEGVGLGQPLVALGYTLALKYTRAGNKDLRKGKGLLLVHPLQVWA